MKPRASEILSQLNTGRISESQAERMSRQYYGCPLPELDEVADMEDEDEDEDGDEDGDDW